MLTQGQTGWSTSPPSMRPNRYVVEALASAFLDGTMTVEGVAARGMHTLGRRWAWLRPLSRRYVKAFAGQTRPRHQDVVQFLLYDQGLRHAWSKPSSKLAVRHWPIEPHRMQPVAATKWWGLPKIESAVALAEWLGVDIGYLEWFA